MENRNLEVMEKMPVPKAVFKNVIPAIVSMLMVLVYNLADTFFIGQTGNPYMVAAVSVATPVFLLFMAMGILFGIGGTSVISRAMGQKRYEYAKKVSAFCFWAGAVAGVVCMVIIWVFSDSICASIGTSGETFEFAKSYLNIVAIGIPFVIISTCFSNIVRAEGKSTTAMLGVLVGNLANIILDPIMILGFGWDVEGAAIATVIGNVIGAAFYVVYFARGKSALSISPKLYAAKGICKNVLAIGVPASLMSMMMSISNIIVNNLMNGYGDMAVAGLGVSMKVMMIVAILLIGLGQGVQPLLGFCFGARLKDRFKKVLRFSLLFGLVFGSVLTVFSYIFAPNIVGAFLSDPAASEYGVRFARTLLISGPVIGMLFVMINTIQAMGAAKPSLILALSRQGLIYLPILFIFNALIHTETGIVAAQPVADYCALIFAVVLFRVSSKRLMKDF